MPLNIECNFADPDAFYARLIDLHTGLSDRQSLDVNEKLMALLSACIPEPAIVDEAATIAAAAGAGSEDDRPAYVARLILLLANHIGDIDRIGRAFGEARNTAR